MKYLNTIKRKYLGIKLWLLRKFWPSAYRRAVYGNCPWLINTKSHLVLEKYCQTLPMPKNKGAVASFKIVYTTYANTNLSKGHSE